MRYKRFPDFAVDDKTDKAAAHIKSLSKAALAYSSRCVQFTNVYNLCISELGRWISFSARPSLWI